MIPYIAWHTIDLGPVHLQVWGLFVAVGFLLGAATAGWLAKRRGQDPKIIFDLLPWLIVAGLVGGRLGDLVYRPSVYWQRPLEIFFIWQGGLSIFGGLLLASLVAVLYLRHRKVDLLSYADTLAFGLPIGIALGRIGCFLIHDHPGTVTHFVLGVRYPDGNVRHDLGLEEALFMFVLALVFAILGRRPRPRGFYLASFCTLYGAVRFGLDFLRILDVRYFGLTPAQYLCLVLTAFGLLLFMWISKQQKKGALSTIALE